MVRMATLRLSARVIVAPTGGHVLILRPHPSHNPPWAEAECLCGWQFSGAAVGAMWELWYIHYLMGGADA